jgi:RNA polymerase sigma factor (sigma-70 family)
MGLEEAYQRYRLELRRFFAGKVRDPQSVDDLIQAMYVSLKKARPREDIRDPLKYLYGMAWNLVLLENRRMNAERARTVPCAFDEYDSHAARWNRLWVEDDAPSEQQRQELERVLAQLPTACQVAVLRQYRDNRSYKEIADELGVTTHTVKKYMMRALNHFRMHFSVNELGESEEGKR